MSKARNYCFTINNPSEGDRLDRFSDEDNRTVAQVRYIVGQMEKGENGTTHIQGYVQFLNAIGVRTACRRLGGRAHIEIARGTPKQASDYCKKSDTRIDGPWEYGIISLGQGSRTDIRAMQALLTEKGLSAVALEMPEMIVRHPNGVRMLNEMVTRTNTMKKRLDLKVVVIYGPPGSGKTRSVYDKEGFEDVYPLSYNEGKVWFDGYCGQSVLLIDDFYGAIKYSYILNLLDIYPLRLEVKGGSTWANWTRVYITSNEHPTQWYKNVLNRDALFRRIHDIVKLDGEKL